jgi:hypothetical protein
MNDQNQTPAVGSDSNKQQVSNEMTMNGNSSKAKLIDAAVDHIRSTQPIKNKQFLQDDYGNKSAMRLMSLIALFASIGFGGLYFWQQSKLQPQIISLQQASIKAQDNELNTFTKIALLPDKDNPSKISTLASLTDLAKINAENVKIFNASDQDINKVIIIGAFLFSAFAGKAVQKFAEQSDPDTLLPLLQNELKTDSHR